MIKQEEQEHIAYSGEKFTIEWYCDDFGKSQALSYYKTLTTKERKSVLYLFKRMGDTGEIRDVTKFNYEGNQIYAFKPQPERFLCFFFQAKKIIITNAFRKKQDKLPPKEKEKALRNKTDYEDRTYTGKYYE